jgi:hypothetical protein
MPIGGENASLVPTPEPYPNAFDVVGWWDDPATLNRKFLIVFVPNSKGKQGREAVFDALEFLMLCAPQWRQSAIAVPPEKLTPHDQLRIDEMLRARARRNLEASFWSTDAPAEIDGIAPKNSFLKVPVYLLSEEPEF